MEFKELKKEKVIWNIPKAEELIKSKTLRDKIKK